MVRGLFFDVKALVYGPEGADFLSEVLRGEGIQAEPAEVADALARLPREFALMRSSMREEEQENDYNRAMLPSLLANLGVPHPTDALLFRLVESVYEYPAYFSMYPEVLPVLRELRSRGLKLAVVANWEPSLARLVREFELDEYFDAVIASTAVGAAKPDGFIFHRALKQLGMGADEVLHVGPSIREDVTGAMNAGIRPVWLNRLEIPTGHEVLTVTDLRGVLLLTQPLEH